MFVSDTLSRLHIKAQDDVTDMIHLNFLQHLNTGYIHHNYENLAYTLCEHRAKQIAKIITKPEM